MYNLNEIIASTCLCDINEVNLNITDDFESMEVFENLYFNEPIHTKTVQKQTKSEEEELSDEDFLDFLN